MDSRREAKGTARDAKRMPEGGQSEAKRSQRGAKGAQREAKESQGQAKGKPREAKRRPEEAKRSHSSPGRQTKQGAQFFGAKKGTFWKLLCAKMQPSRKRHFVILNVKMDNNVVFGSGASCAVQIIGQIGNRSNIRPVPGVLIFRTVIPRTVIPRTLIPRTVASSQTSYSG